jgi:nitrite reductase/ring-hydroxylating ferredoxin subunit
LRDLGCAGLRNATDYYDVLKLQEETVEQLIARVDDIPLWGLKFPYRCGKLEEEGILIRLESGEIRAFKNECQHLPMRLDVRSPFTYWDASGKHLLCSSHGALFRLNDGHCVSGPCAGQHLVQLPIEIRNGEVLLAVSEP